MTSPIGATGLITISFSFFFIVTYNYDNIYYFHRLVAKTKSVSAVTLYNSINRQIFFFFFISIKWFALRHAREQPKKGEGVG
ncbi:hypothetical protein F4775DRAFT_534714 [Biscogniauxia sp. FL1348]|nr:hypothetical protein F4775DRAFT_534714 [Biscogniauxia sp. FL1348]